MTRAQRWRVILVLAAAGIPVQSQVPIRVDTTHVAPPDTAGGRTVSTSLQHDSLAVRPSRSPLLAMGLSALLPGGGQVYNRSYWKVPLILGLGGYFIYEMIDNHRQYADYRDQYQAGLATIPDGDPNILRLREFYKNQRDSFGWYFLILYFVNIADAYVDASLFGFDVGDNLGFRGGIGGPAVTVRLWLR